MNPPRRVLTVGLIALSIALRVAACLDPPTLNTDEARYLVAAHHLRSGAGYSDWRGPEIDIHPLHPLLVAALGADPRSLEIRGRVVALVCSILLLWPLARATGRLGGQRAVCVYWLVAGVHPWLVKAAAAAQPESLYDLLVAAAIVVLIESSQQVRPPLAFLAGSLFGLAYLARPEGFLVGLLAGAVAFLARDRWNLRRAAGFCVFVAALVLFSSPYLIFLRRATGAWTLTGKVGELFFVGQSLYDAGTNTVDVSVYGELMQRWRGVLPFILANPGVVALRVLRNLALVWGWTMPLALGPAGIVGLALSAALIVRRADFRLRMVLWSIPCLTLVLMLLTFENHRVIASVLPFLFVIVAVGLAGVVERSSSTLAALAACALLWWTPALVRSAVGPRAHDPAPEAVAVALRVAGRPDGIVSNNPALSFMAGDPVMLGPPGRYRPLPWNGSCFEIAAEARARGATVAVLDGDEPFNVDFDSPACPLTRAATLRGSPTARAIQILTWK